MTQDHSHASTNDERRKTNDQRPTTNDQGPMTNDQPARHLDAELAPYRRTGCARWWQRKTLWPAVSPQPRLASNERPDLAKGRPPRRANAARRDLAPDRSQRAG